MNKRIFGIISLTSICVVVSVLLALTNYITSPIIKEQENAAVMGALGEVLEGAKTFENISLSEYTFPESITEAYSSDNGGYVFKMNVTGYSTGMVILCGVTAEGAVSGAKCLSSSETLGYEKTYGENFPGVTLETLDSVDTVAGATRTTSGYKNAVKDALNAFVIIGGGEVDLRTEEEILLDNLKEALPEGEGEFEKLFIAETLSVTKRAYKAKNGAGLVLETEEGFFGVGKNGETENKAVEEDAKLLINSSLTGVDIEPFELPSQILAVYKTGSGNYVFDLRAAGFGINGNNYYNPSGEYIKIKLSMTEEGKIISAETIYQKESEGYGSGCEDKEFYEQFNGKTAEDYKNIDGISGATITTNGYKTAIGKAFEALEQLKGEK